MSKKLTIEQFRKRYNGSPIDQVEMADRITEELEDHSLREAAEMYLKARAEYFVNMALYDVELG